jgi:hypothetical protein
MFMPKKLYNQSACCDNAGIAQELCPSSGRQDDMLQMICFRYNWWSLLQAYALSKASEGTGLPELLLAQPLPPPQVRIIVDPPSTWEHSPRVTATTMPTSSNGMLGSSNFLGVTGGIDEEGGEADNIPDDVPLTRSMLQAKVGSCRQL